MQYFLLILSADHCDNHDNIDYYGAVWQKQSSAFCAALHSHDRYIGVQLMCMHPTGTTLTIVCFQK